MKQKIHNLSKLYAYVLPHKALLFAALIALIITSSSVLGIGKALQFLIDEAISKNNLELLDDAYVLLIGVTIVLAISTFARFYCITTLGEKVVADIRRDVFAHVMRLDVEYFEKTKTGEILSRITTDTTVLQNVVGSSLSIALRNLLLLVGGSALLFTTSAQLTAYMFLVLPLVVGPIIFYGRRVKKYSKYSQEKISQISSTAEETLNAVRTIKSLLLEDAQNQKYERKVKGVLKAAKKRITARSLLTAIVIVLIFGAIVTILWVGGRSVIAGEITAGDLSAFVFYSIIVAGSVGALSEVAGDILKAAGASERLMEIMATKNKVREIKNAKNIVGKKLSIEFKKVGFAYPAAKNRKILKDISFKIAPGEKIAFVGKSGSGKTTIFNLLERFYDATSGEILIAGEKIKTLSLKDLRASFALVPQEPVIFSGSIASNIALGNTRASEEDIIAACKQAGAWEFVKKFERGLQTNVGEKGVRLSGGQRQRLAIARALLSAPEILLLDEATSNLDSENEKLVTSAIENLMQKHTTLVIAHRLSTVKKADKIIVMDDGKIDAIGTHTQLMKNSEIYKNLAKLQLS